MANVTVWDIETGPLDEDTVRRRVSLKAKSVTLKTDDDRAKAMAEWTELAALSPETAKVLAIGYGGSGGQKEVVGILDDDDTEGRVLEDFWQRVANNDRAATFVGFNTSFFDIPFVIRRSWYLDIQFPKWVLPDKYGKWPAMFIDIAEHWSLRKWGQKISLNLLCESCGIEGKNGEGKDFARLWATDRVRASEYLLNDLRMTWEVGKRLGVF